MADFNDPTLASLIEDNRSLRKEVVDILLSIAILRELHFELPEPPAPRGTATPKSKLGGARLAKARGRSKLKSSDRRL
jgi:hypothetical protein